MRTRATVVRLAGLMLAVGVAAGAAERPLEEGDLEVFYLDALADPSRWSPAECTVATAPEQLAPQGPALHLHISVDHHAGEVKYPVGWPRMYCALRQPLETGWDQYDRFEFRVFTTSSRNTLPARPLSFQVQCPDRHTSKVVELTSLQLGQWVNVSVPCRDIPNLPALTRLGFNISESNYNHGDVLDVYIGGFRLVRSTTCRVDALTTRNAALFEGSPILRLHLNVVGPPETVSRGLPMTLRQGDRILRRETLPVRRGQQTLEVEISELELPPGIYDLIVFEDDDKRRRNVSFRVVESPWQEP